MANNDITAAEAAAPLASGELLPLRVTTLEYIPPAAREQYHRSMDGSFKLAFVHNGSREAAAYLKEISDGQLNMYNPDQTAVDRDAEAARVARNRAEVAAELDRLQAEEDRKKQERMEALVAKRKAELDLELQQFRKQVLGVPTDREKAELAEIEAMMAKSKR